MGIRSVGTVLQMYCSVRRKRPGASRRPRSRCGFGRSAPRLSLNYRVPCSRRRPPSAESAQPCGSQMSVLGQCRLCQGIERGCVCPAATTDLLLANLACFCVWLAPTACLLACLLALHCQMDLSSLPTPRDAPCRKLQFSDKPPMCVGLPEDDARACTASWQLVD